MRILQIAIVFFWFSQYVYVPFQTPYLASLDVSSKFIGVIVGTYGVSQMVLRFPVGILAATSTASIFRILLDNGNGFLIGNLLSGVASAVWISFMVLYMSFFRKEEQQKATARLVMANNIGMLLGFVVSTLLYDRIGMKWLCAMSIAGGVISIVLCLFLPKGGDVKKVRVGPLIQICTQKRFRWQRPCLSPRKLWKIFQRIAEWWVCHRLFICCLL